MIQLKGGYLIRKKYTETQLVEKIKNLKLHYNWTNLQIFRTAALYCRMYDILTMIESDMKEDILSVPELPRHTTSSEIFKVLNGFIEERGLEWKNCVGV